MGQAEYHFVMFLLCSRQSLCFPCTLYIIFCLNYFSCYSMVTKFYCKIISTMSMLAYYDPSSSRLCDSMSPQILFVCYHLPTRRRAGVKLGDVDTLQTYL